MSVRTTMPAPPDVTRRGRAPSHRLKLPFIAGQYADLAKLAAQKSGLTLTTWRRCSRRGRSAPRPCHPKPYSAGALSRH